MARRERIPIETEIREGHESLVSIFQDFGVPLDYSMESLQRIESYIEENYPRSEGGNNPFPAVRAGVKLFYLGAYLGEVLRKKVGGQWVFDERHPLGQIQAELRLSNGKTLRPIEEIMNRVEEGKKLLLHPLARQMV